MLGYAPCESISLRWRWWDARAACSRSVAGVQAAAPRMGVADRAGAVVLQALAAPGVILAQAVAPEQAGRRVPDRAGRQARDRVGRPARDRVGRRAPDRAGRRAPDRVDRRGAAGRQEPEVMPATPAR